jgi:hypothetical protein
VNPADNDETRQTRVAGRTQTLRCVSGRKSEVSASIRILTARAMLRKGRDPLTVAQATHVPQALVELMRDIDVDPRPRRTG